MDQKICALTMYRDKFVYLVGVLLISFKRKIKTSQNELLWHQNDSQSLFWFIVPAQQERFSPTDDGQKFSHQFAYLSPPHKKPLKVNNNQMNIPIYSLFRSLCMKVKPTKKNDKIYSNKFNSSSECVSSSNEIMRKVLFSTFRKSL